MVRRRSSPGYTWARRHSLTTAGAAAAWKFQELLEQSQWYDTERHAGLQLRQLEALLRHATDEVPYYRRALSGLGTDSEFDPAVWSGVPILTRADLQRRGDELVARNVPAQHGETSRTRSSGSTGRPVEVLHTELSRNWHTALSFRSQLWALNRFDLPLAAIRRYPGGVADYPDGFSAERWVDDMTLPSETGAVAGLTVATPIHDQVAWLADRAPRVLMTFPSNLMALSRHILAGRNRPKPLKRILTVGEAHPEGLRGMARRAFGAEIYDVYSAYEVGAIALQCPISEAYHVQSESLLVEIVDEEGQPCLIGQTGRVVVTPLHNYAMPLIRYEIGDHATVGRTCRCGRGLPVIKQVLGRHRNMMRLPDGSTIWPSFGVKFYADIAPVTQVQFIQHSVKRLEGRLVADRRLTAAEEDAVRKIVRAGLPAPFEITFSYPDEIARGESGKFEEFVSRVDEAVA